MTTEILQRFDGKPRELGDLFVLTKEHRAARCHLVTNPVGWECRLAVGHGLMMSQVCRSPGEVFTTWVTWRTTMKERGWS